MSINILDTASVLIFGAVVGSFLNVVIIRLKTGRTIVKGRSMCMSCGKALSWWELIPVLSYLLLRGRCSNCKGEVSFQYPVVEWGTALLFLISYFAVSASVEKGGLATLLFLWIQIALFIIISGYDLRHKIIPDEPLSILGLVALIKTVTLGIGSSFAATLTMFGWQILTAFLLFLPFYLIWRLSSGRWMGLGDAKVALVIGLLLPGIAGLSAILLAFYIGAVTAVSIIMAGRIGQVLVPKTHRGSTLGMNSEIPFGPFLALGAIFVSLYEAGAFWLLPFLPFMSL